jgi:hypothetical protein
LICNLQFEIRDAKGMPSAGLGKPLADRVKSPRLYRFMAVGTA